MVLQDNVRRMGAVCDSSFQWVYSFAFHFGDMRRNRKLLLKRFSIIAGGLFLLFALVNYVIMPAYVNSGGTQSVPNVVGLMSVEARSLLDSLELEPIEAETKPDPKAPVGAVIAQNPPSDAVVRKGRRVYLTLSGGEVLIVVPKIRGLSARDSRFVLERSGLQLGEIAYDTSSTYPENTVISQSVPPGTKVSRGKRVSAIVSQGRGLLDVVVPNVFGKTLSEAERILNEQGFGKGNITYQSSYELLPNTIVDQFPRGGEPAIRGEKVDLFVVKGGKPKDESQFPEQ